MYCRSLKELPPPPPGKTGWPWTEETPLAPATLPNGTPWPRISIVTPSYNQGQFIEETIRSVLLQGYPNLEYFIMDGGSKDQSAEIIRKYECWLDGWVSEKDRGQSHAINKGLALCTGETWTWLCSDDQFASGALQVVGRTWAEQQPHIVTGRGQYVTSNERNVLCEFTGKPARRPADLLLGRCSMLQPATYYSMEVTHKLNGVQEDLHYLMDCDFLMRQLVLLGHIARIVRIPNLLATAIIHPNCKTSDHPANRKATEQLITSFYPYFTWWDRRVLAWHRLRQRTVGRVVEAAQNQPGSRSALLGLAVRCPLVLGAGTFYRAFRSKEGV